MISLMTPQLVDAPTAPDLPSRRIVGTRVDGTSYADAASRVCAWAAAGESRYVCVCTVHMVMEGHDDPDFQRVVNAADLVTPDGVPLVWCLRSLGVEHATRVYGPDLTPLICGFAAERGIPIGFYGGAPEVVERMTALLGKRYPGLEIAYSYSPPFRELTDAEEAEAVDAIRASGARILFVGLGCPKQEMWMARHRDRVPAVMLGVGAAFDFIARVKPQAPGWLQRAGLEWAFRLATEPGRLWWRYLYHNPRFIVAFARQRLAWKRAARHDQDQ